MAGRHVRFWPLAAAPDVSAFGVKQPRPKLGHVAASDSKRTLKQSGPKPTCQVPKMFWISDGIIIVPVPTPTGTGSFTSFDTRL
jgi:hypothetical protein